MRITEKSVQLLRQALQCLIYIGLGHVAFEAVTTYQTPEYSSLWYYAFLVPGIYYFVPILVLLLSVIVCEKLLKK